MIKQIIIIRKDLNMRKGKMIAQGAHASMKVFFDRITETFNYKHGEEFLWKLQIERITDNMLQWVNGIFTKICVSVNSEVELLELHKKAQDEKLPVALIQDCGLTEFKGVPTYTCLAIGPDESEKIDKITGHLPLL